MLTSPLGTESDLDCEMMQWSRTIENIIDENPDLWTAEETAELAERQRFLREQEERYEQDVRAGVIVEMEWPGEREFEADAAVPDDPHERDEWAFGQGSADCYYYTPCDDSSANSALLPHPGEDEGSPLPSQT